MKVLAKLGRKVSVTIYRRTSQSGTQSEKLYARENREWRTTGDGFGQTNSDP
jgi:hypothetical protein